jgi:hypothetical protein
MSTQIIESVYVSGHQSTNREYYVEVTWPATSRVFKRGDRLRAALHDGRIVLRLAAETERATSVTPTGKRAAVNRWCSGRDDSVAASALFSPDFGRTLAPDASFDGTNLTIQVPPPKQRRPPQERKQARRRTHALTARSTTPTSPPTEEAVTFLLVIDGKQVANCKVPWKKSIPILADLAPYLDT